MKASYSSLSEAITDFQQKGYTVDFNLAEDHLKSKSLKRKWNPDDLTVVKFYRFEGESNPADNSILYVIETTDGEKGLLVDVYGAQTGTISDEMIRKLKIDIQR
ncbi:MAG: phosphoribosylpyrophosphate synthetase [Flavobacteriaceae bacterium]